MKFNSLEKYGLKSRII